MEEQGVAITLKEYNSLKEQIKNLRKCVDTCKKIADDDRCYSDLRLRNIQKIISKYLEEIK